MALVSVVIPLYNEIDNVSPLCTALGNALGDADAEVIVVDDGSRDGSAAALDREAEARGPRFKVIHLQRNFGQTAAMQAGIDVALGEVIVTLDADLQNDPEDILPLARRLLEENLDVVAGWRKNRQDGLLLRKIPSRIANRLIRRLTGVYLHDYGCTLKAYRASVIKGVRLYGEMHRFIPAWLSTLTYTDRIVEVPVRHHPRRAGQSKYGITRTFRVLVDLLFVKFFLGYSQRPMHFFGVIGLILLSSGSAMLLYLFVDKFGYGATISGRPMLIAGVLFFLAGLQFLNTGILGEMLVRVYHESQDKKTYVVRHTVHLDPPA
ncbi:glycosyltransferase family 2 protein [Acidithiobacillus ferrooxidans]|uniref:glycosyltransferase family 2 protein n=1 Tax=Acidithiobacillus ferrooxidans TaxID=920 RepID=UPI0013CF4044|nr:glycosyltransferase family 2 protein [Acidithiobacillus ferrooxidans]MBU2856450.1 glycosyltransferase family 2 protein [Acidithiobacillus ferrooxidans]MBU2860959.1 glycosyltransferase family 2 protein [Acidithiobacillus ferrooxidans]